MNPPMQPVGNPLGGRKVVQRQETRDALEKRPGRLQTSDHRVKPLPHERPDEAAARVSQDHDPRPDRAPPARPGVGQESEPDEMQLADQYGQVADEMCDVLHENRIPSTAELDAWERALHRLDSESWIPAVRRAGRRGDAVGQGWGKSWAIWRENGDPANLLNDEIAARAESPVARGMGDSLTSTIAERLRELEDARDAPAVIAQRDAEAARLAARRAPPPPPRRRSFQTAAAHRQVSPRPVRACIYHRIMRYFIRVTEPHHQGRRQMATRIRKFESPDDR